MTGRHAQTTVNRSLLLCRCLRQFHRDFRRHRRTTGPPRLPITVTSIHRRYTPSEQSITVRTASPTCRRLHRHQNHRRLFLAIIQCRRHQTPALVTVRGPNAVECSPTSCLLLPPLILLPPSCAATGHANAVQFAKVVTLNITTVVCTRFHRGLP